MGFDGLGRLDHQWCSRVLEPSEYPGHDLPPSSLADFSALHPEEVREPV